jgi:hypothetical protein
MKAEERKRKTEEALAKLNVQINPNLPLMESEEDAQIRDAQSIAERCLVLYSLIAVAHEVPRENAIELLKDNNLWTSVSPEEKAFFESASPSKKEVIKATWRAEALWVLLWSLGYIKKLDWPSEYCDVSRIQDIMPNTEEGILQFRNVAKLRSVSEILDELDFIYRIDWAVVDARIQGKVSPARINPSIVYERHCALNWLASNDIEWDDITTDT